MIPKDTALKLDITKFIVKYDNKTVKATIKSCNPTQITNPGKADISCTVNYENKDYALSVGIETTKEKEENKPVEKPEEDNNEQTENKDNNTNNDESPKTE